MYQLLISDETRLDILDAFAWYENRRAGLGKDFELCLEAGFNLISRDPSLFQKRYKDLRIYFIDRFPYGIHYLVDENTIKVFGVFHTSRSPTHWKIRSSPKL
ncbi:type II toxin-antitoxin system RelE/ParE family toxin [Mucilaginibacter sp. UR6-11]|uniref:type II toxin-antitoxin system RelE/ParE family toxin n=1 Tax=Mucilaginibacter sp. UR6-11 TaxID=1435644 RepID=UPI001E306C92|nr:type II toxin-antitoxin system RelE/ParE family toxin [Mucilaginibacter sp. UR6-11]MCC8425398.1 type II toxin-antitoxin system RelE/ParE family toxin [Mucilaginibacter sp. UR6-11]